MVGVTCPWLGPTKDCQDGFCVNMCCIIQSGWVFLKTKTVCLVLGTEFVVVEDSSCQDTNAIILKGTAVLTYKPCLKDRPFSGSLAGVEVMSDPHASIALKKLFVPANTLIPLHRVVILDCFCL